jgi:hypothetical protein
MRIILVLAAAVGFVGAAAAPALAQRFPFERAFDVGEVPIVEVVTNRGKVDVTVGAPGRIVVSGLVTVRLGWDVPSNAVELARRVAGNPPVVRAGDLLRLRTPVDDAERRAVIVSYQIQVPPNAAVTSTTDSGATAIRSVSGPVTVRTQSASIDLTELGGDAAVNTGSGVVRVDGVGGALTVMTGSSGFTGRALRGAVSVRTESGAVDIRLQGPGDVDVETGSSLMRVRDARGGLIASTRSGSVTIEGSPGGDWKIFTGSSAIEITTPTGAAFTLDALTDSSSVRVDGDAFRGSISKRQAAGPVAAGGPTVRVNSRSGSIRMRVGAR